MPCVYCGSAKDVKNSLCVDAITCVERKDRMARRKKVVEEAEVEVIDEFVQEREDLTLEFSKIALNAILSHAGSDAWPEIAIAKRVRGVARALSCEFYPIPVKPESGAEALFMETGQK